MGAYYMATLAGVKKKSKPIGLNPWDYDNGAKLMEHSYIGNNYVNLIMNELLDDSKSVVWLCNNHTADEITTRERENIKVVKRKSKKLSLDINDNKYFIVNLTKGEFIDMKQLKKLYRTQKEKNNGWDIHPLPILTNSERGSAEEVDYSIEGKRRGVWAEDVIYTTKTKPSDNFLDITADSLFFRTYQN